MSDLQQGPGWWVASDGKWYPPDLHPQARSAPLPPPPTATPPGGAGPVPMASAPVAPAPLGNQPYAAPAPAYAVASRRSASSGLAGTIQGFSWAVAACSVMAAIMGIAALASFNTYWDTPINSRAEARAYDDWVTFDDGFGGFAGFAFLSGFVLWILLMIWMNLAHKATQDLWAGDRRWSSGWTVGGWFIPVANAVIPRLVIAEIEQIAFAPRTNGVLSDASWRTRSTETIGKLWWIAVVVGMLMSSIGSSIGADIDASSGDIRAGYVVAVIGFVVLAASGVLGALYIRRLGRRLSADGMLQST